MRTIQNNKILNIRAQLQAVLGGCFHQNYPDLHLSKAPAESYFVCARDYFFHFTKRYACRKLQHKKGTNFSAGEHTI
jgi:hypothetical protein